MTPIIRVDPQYIQKSTPELVMIRGLKFIDIGGIMGHCMHPIVLIDATPTPIFPHVLHSIIRETGTHCCLLEPKRETLCWRNHMLSKLQEDQSLSFQIHELEMNVIVVFTPFSELHPSKSLVCNKKITRGSISSTF